MKNRDTEFNLLANTLFMAASSAFGGSVMGFFAWMLLHDPTVPLWIRWGGVLITLGFFACCAEFVWIAVQEWRSQREFLRSSSS